jgi:hypothetical protein
MLRIQARKQPGSFFVKAASRSAGSRFSRTWRFRHRHHKIVLPPPDKHRMFFGKYCTRASSVNHFLRADEPNEPSWQRAWQRNMNRLSNRVSGLRSGCKAPRLTPAPQSSPRHSVPLRGRCLENGLPEPHSALPDREPFSCRPSQRGLPMTSLPSSNPRNRNRQP